MNNIINKLQMTSTTNDAVSHVIVVIIMVVGIFIIRMVRKMKIKKKRLLMICEGCGKTVNYDREIEWEVIREETKQSKQSNQGTSVTNKAIVNIEKTCEQCGKVYKTSRTVVTARYSDTRGWSYYNLENSMKSFFK